MSTSDVGVELGDGVRQRVGHHQPPLGVGVGDLGGAPAVVAYHVTGAQRVAADGVLGGGDQAGDPHRAADGRAARPAPTMHHGAAGHVALHVDHRLGGLDRQAAGVEGDALADQHHVRRLPGALAGRVVEPDQPRRGGRGLPDAEDAAEPVGARAGPRPRPSTARPVSSASSIGLLGEPGGVLDVGRHGGEHPRAPAGAAEGDRPGERAACSASSGTSASTTRPTGGCSGAPERRWKPNEPSITPTTNASSPSSSGEAATEVATAARSRAARASAAPARRRSSWPLLADADELDPAAASAFSAPPSGTGHDVTSPALPVAFVELEDARAGRGRPPRRARRRRGRAAATRRRRRPGAPASAIDLHSADRRAGAAR